MSIASDNLNDTDFFEGKNQIVFQVLKSFAMDDKPGEVSLVCEELKRQDRLKLVGGVSYVITLAQYAGVGAHVAEYIRIVKDMSTLRRMITAAQKIQTEALTKPSDVQQSLDNAQQLLFEIGKAASNACGSTIKDIISGSFTKELEERYQHFLNSGKEFMVTGIPTGFIDLDKIINGFNKSNLMILAARPAMGKTALAINIAENISFKSKIPVGVFSLEMSKDQLTHRIISSQSEVDSAKITTGKLTPIEFEKICFVSESIKDYHLIINDTASLTIGEIRSSARRMKEKYSIGFLVIDYLQLIAGMEAENRQNEIAKISRLLKILAKELDIPILCLSQLSRKVEERNSKRPLMSDLRDSGSIEQDADLVMFLVREEYYDSNSHPGEAELIIAKNRHGAIGSVKLAFRKEIAKFSNFTPLKSLREQLV